MKHARETNDMDSDNHRGVAIVTAMGIESAGLSKALEVGPWNQRLRRGWHEGLLAGRPVVLATCGVGVLAAGRWAQVLLEDYEPGAVVLTGASGGVSPDVEVGDLVLAEAVCRVQGTRVVARYPSDSELLDLARNAAQVPAFRPVRGRLPRVLTGRVGTIDAVLHDRARGEQLAHEHQILAVEMEGAAIAQACHEHGVPFLAVRAISDVIGRPWQWLTVVRDLVPAQRNAERLVFALVQHLQSQ
jgi:adenosylhomocysteine nucleosidase